MKRLLITAAVVSLLASVLASPGVAAKKCKKYAPGPFHADGSWVTPEPGLITVTDRATESAPLELAVEVPQGTLTADGHLYLNVQVDSKKASTGLYVRWEFPVYEDNDLYMYTPDGETPAYAAGFNPAPFGPADGTGDGGHSEQGAEQIDGLRTKDCGGYTIDLWAYTHRGGETLLKVWLAPED